MQTAPTSKSNEPAAPAERHGYPSLEAVIRTDERYGNDSLFEGPRGWHYWNYLAHPKPFQNPNLWPDMASTFFLSQLTMPAGSTLTLRATYPHIRYFQFAVYREERGTYVSIGEEFTGQEIEPDAGSSNPFLVGANRLAEPRNFTLQVLADAPPIEPNSRMPNTLYVGRGGSKIQIAIRIYLADHGRDGAGWGTALSPFSGPGLPSYEVTLADGTRLSPEEFVTQFVQKMQGNTEPPFSAEQWVRLVQAKDNDPKLEPSTAPARREPKWEKFWTLAYSVVGAFKTPEDRASIPYAGPMEGGGDGPYLLTYLSRRFGPVYVVRGKMPVFPNTYAGEEGKGLAVMPEAQTQYWSLVSCEAPPSGRVVDGVTDMQVPLDEDGNYTIVVSRHEDRPRNATPANGVAWVAWSPRGEGLDDPRNRADFGMLIMRIMGNHPSWLQSPDQLSRPDMEQAIMGPYYPRGQYTSKEEFEAKGTQIRAKDRPGSSPLFNASGTDSTPDQGSNPPNRNHGGNHG
jgi:hypothetical protein